MYKATLYLNDAMNMIDKQLSIMVSYVDIIGLCHSVASISSAW